MKRICTTIWATGFLVRATECILYEIKSHSTNEQEPTQWVAALVVTAIPIFLYCYGKIYFMLRRNKRQIHPEIRKHINSDIVLRLSSLHVVVFISSMLPGAILYFIDGSSQPMMLRNIFSSSNCLTAYAIHFYFSLSTEIS